VEQNLSPVSGANLRSLRKRRRDDSQEKGEDDCNCNISSFGALLVARNAQVRMYVYLYIVCTALHNCVLRRLLAGWVLCIVVGEILLYPRGSGRCTRILYGSSTVRTSAGKILSSTS
jgi:hypothetical protein